MREAFPCPKDNDRGHQEIVLPPTEDEVERADKINKRRGAQPGDPNFEAAPARHICAKCKVSLPTDRPCPHNHAGRHSFKVEGGTTCSKCRWDRTDSKGPEGVDEFLTKKLSAEGVEWSPQFGWQKVS